MEPDVPYLVGEMISFLWSFFFIVGVSGLWAALLLPSKSGLLHQLQILEGSAKAQKEAKENRLSPRSVVAVLTEGLAPVAWFSAVFAYLPVVGAMLGAMCALPVAMTVYKKAKEGRVIADMVLDERYAHIIQTLESPSVTS